MIKNTRLKIIAGLIIVLAVSGFLPGLILALWFTNSNYNDLVIFITSSLNRPDLFNIITTKLFTPGKYKAVYSFHWIVYPLLFGLLAWIIYARLVIANYCYRAGKFILVSFKNILFFFGSLTTIRKIIIIGLLCLYIICQLYVSYLKPITYDEAWGYNYYGSKPFYFSIFIFNTYPLYNLISHLFIFLPLDTLISLRLPSIIFGTLSLVTLFYSVSKYIGKFEAGIAVLMLFASSLFPAYSVLGKGVSLSIFFTIIVFHSAISLINQNEKSGRYRFLFIAGNVLGIIAMPTFIIYSLASLLFVLYGNYKSKRGFQDFLINGLLILVCSILFYLPVIFTTSSAVIFHNNHYVFNLQDVIQGSFTSYLDFSTSFFSIRYFTAILVLVNLLLQLHLSTRNKLKDLLFYSLFVIGLTIICTSATGNVLPDRSLNFLLIAYILLLIRLVAFLKDYLFSRARYISACLVMLFMGFQYYTNQKYFVNVWEDKEAKILAGILLKNNVENAYLFEDKFWLFVPAIQYYYTNKKEQIKFTTSLPTSTRYLPFNDSVGYDCIVTPPFPNTFIDKGFREIYRTTNFIVWGK